MTPDVADVLGYSNSHGFTQLVSEDYKGHSKIVTPGGAQHMTVISERGMYEGLARSNRDLAKDFQDWLWKHLKDYRKGERPDQPALSPDGLEMIAKEFREQEVRLTEIDGELHVAAADVADVLGYNHTPNFTTHVREKYKGVRKLNTPGGPQEMTVISELGIYDGLSSAEPSRLLSVYALLADTSRRKTRSKLLSGWAAVVESGTLNQAELGRSV